MLILLSPAKTLDFDPHPLRRSTQPVNMEKTSTLIQQLQHLTSGEIGALMKLSDNLSELNYRRFQTFSSVQALDINAKQALLAFKGDVYRDWPLDTYSDDDFGWAQDHLRILSGLYGLLKPLDLIQPYRLEMGTKLQNNHGKHLYAFWGSILREQLEADLKAQGSELIVNLASLEYFKAAQGKKLQGRIVSPTFKDFHVKSGTFKILAFYAKRARGAMAHYLIANRITKVDGLLNFDLNGYKYDAESSSELKPVFLRDQT